MWRLICLSICPCPKAGSPEDEILVPLLGLYRELEVARDLGHIGLILRFGEHLHDVIDDGRRVRGGLDRYRQSVLVGWKG